MDKVIKYIKRCGGIEINSNENREFSRYFLLDNKVIRVSNHIGTNSSGNFHIIVTKNAYLIYNKSTGDIDVVKYNDVKTFIRHANIMSALNVDAEKFDKLQSVPQQSNPIDTILGIPKTKFSQNQLKQIESYVHQMKKK